MTTITATTNQLTASILVEVDLTEATDTFTRVVANGWGSADTGQAYLTANGAASEYSVNGTQGVHAVNAVASSRYTTIAASDADVDIMATVLVDELATGASIRVGLVARYTNTSNLYSGHAFLDTDQSVYAEIDKIVGGSTTILTTGDPIDGLTHTITTVFGLRFQAVGSDLRFKVWDTATSEPTSWSVEATDTDLTAAGRFGFRTRLSTGNTNVLPYEAYYDSLNADATRDVVSIYRVTPDVTETELVGSPIIPSDGSIVLWDTGAPHDQQIYYTAYDVQPELLATSNTVSITGQGDGWLRDPLVPSFDVHLTDCPTGCPTDTGVTLGVLGDEAFASRAGVFDLIGARTPRVVADLRASQAGEAHLTTHTMADRDAVEDLLTSGRVLLWQIHTDYGWRTRNPYYGSDHVTVFDATATRPTTAKQTRSQREWRLPYRTTTPPVGVSGQTGSNGVGAVGARWQDLEDSGQTWAQLEAQGLTWAQVAAGEGY